MSTFEEHPETTREPSVLTLEQQQRTHAILTAAEVLRPRPGRAGVINTAETPLAYVDWTEVVKLADYIVTGQSIALAPPLIFADSGSGSYTLGGEMNIAFADHVQEYLIEEGVGLTHSLLTLVKDEIPGGSNRWDVDAIESWSIEDRQAVVAWASAVHLVASDNEGVIVPAVPAVLHEEGCEYDLGHTGECDTLLDFD